MARLSLLSVEKSFAGRHVLGPLSLDVGDGEIVAITGPSGAGKTTTCRLITGLDQPDVGDVQLGEERLSAMPPQARRVAHMFESYALYPHLTVAENIAFPLGAPGRRRLYSREDVAKRVAEVLAMTEIAHLSERKPGALSGGQKQRVALCRALAQDAAVYVMDEPLSHLDAKLRNALRGAVRRRQVARQAPTLWSTPDAMEALSIADRVAVLIDGDIAQIGAPEEIYQSPASTKVARLIGDPAMNLLPGELVVDAQGVRFVGNGASLSLPLSQPPEMEDNAVILGVRPSSLTLCTSDENTIPATVYAWEPFGKYSIITAKSDDVTLRVKTPSPERVEANTTIRLSIVPSGIVLFDKKSGRLLPTSRTQQKTKELAL